MELTEFPSNSRNTRKWYGHKTMAKYVNPIGSGLVTGRIDMGVDFSGSGNLYAMGNGVITNVYNSGWPGGTFIGLKMDDGKYVYYAENIAPAVHVGQRVKAGQKVGFARGSYPFVEIGWAAAPGTGETLAASANQQQHSGDPGAKPTGYGIAFANVLKGLGVNINPGGQGTPNTGGQSTSGNQGNNANAAIEWSWDWIDNSSHFLGKTITGIIGIPSSIGDVAKAISGLTTEISVAIKLFSWLFNPSHWLRIVAFISGLMLLGASAYFFKQAI